MDPDFVQAAACHSEWFSWSNWMVAIPIDLASDWFSGCHLTLFWPKRWEKSILDFWKSVSGLTRSTFVPAPPAGCNSLSCEEPGSAAEATICEHEWKAETLLTLQGVRWKRKKFRSLKSLLSYNTYPGTSYFQSFCDVNKCSYGLSHCWCFLLL